MDRKIIAYFVNDANKKSAQESSYASCTVDFWGFKPHFSIFCKVAASRTIPFDCAVIVHLTAVCR